MRLEAVKELWERLRRHGVKGLERDADGFTDSELAFGRIVLPVLEDFESTRAQLGEAENRARALMSILDKLPVAALVLDEAGRLLAMNGAARRLLGGVTTRVLEAARKAVRAGEEQEAALSLSGGRSSLRFVPADLEGDAGGESAAGRPEVVFVSRTDTPATVDITPLATRCHLSRSEATVVSLVAQGESNEEIARRLEVSIETVRTHLASAYRKTGAKNRAALVALAFCAPYGHGPIASTERPE